MASVFTPHPCADNPNSTCSVAALAYYQPTGAQSATGQQGLKIFFNPSLVCTDSALSNSRCQITNQANIFHEGLHEFYGLADAGIQRVFGVPMLTDCTADISDYISFTIYSKSVNSCGP